MRILGVDVGTTSMKMGVFDEKEDSVTLVRQFSQEYPVNTYNDGLFSDIEPQKWQQAFIAGCKALGDRLADVEAIALSGTTPGFTAMDAEGRGPLSRHPHAGSALPAAGPTDHRRGRHEDPPGRDGEHARRRRLLAGQPPLDQGQSPGDLREGGRLRPLQHLHGQMAHGIIRHRSLIGVPDGPVQHGQERRHLERGDRRRLRHLPGSAPPRHPRPWKSGPPEARAGIRAWAEERAPRRDRGQRCRPRGLFAGHRGAR